MDNSSKETNGKLKKLAKAFKPLKIPFACILIIWVISGMAANFVLMAWGIATAWLALITALVFLVVDYQAEREKKAGKK